MKRPYKLLIAGSSSIEKDPESDDRVARCLDKLLIYVNKDDNEIIVNTRFLPAQLWARERGYTERVEEGFYAVLFWDGTDTEISILRNHLNRLGIQYRFVRYDLTTQNGC